MKQRVAIELKPYITASIATLYTVSLVPMSLTYLKPLASLTPMRTAKKIPHEPNNSIKTITMEITAGSALAPVVVVVAKVPLVPA